VVAAVIVASGSFGLYPSDMDGILIAGFIAAVVGGLDSPVGAVIGGLLIGIATVCLGILVGRSGIAWGTYHPRRRVNDQTTGHLRQERRQASLMKWFRSIVAQERTTARLTGVLAVTILTLAITFVLPPVADSQLAGGAAISIVILGLSWLVGWSGQISLGNSGFMAVGAYATGIWAVHHGSTPLIFTFFLATVIGAISGLIIAIPVHST